MSACPFQIVYIWLHVCVGGGGGECLNCTMLCLCVCAHVCVSHLSTQEVFPEQTVEKSGPGVQLNTILSGVAHKQVPVPQTMAPRWGNPFTLYRHPSTLLDRWRMPQWLAGPFTHVTIQTAKKKIKRIIVRLFRVKNCTNSLKNIFFVLQKWMRVRRTGKKSHCRIQLCLNRKKGRQRAGIRQGHRGRQVQICKRCKYAKERMFRVTKGDTLMDNRSKQVSTVQKEGLRQSKQQDRSPSASKWVNCNGQMLNLSIKPNRSVLLVLLELLLYT